MARSRLVSDVTKYIKIELIPWRSPHQSCFGRAWILIRLIFKKMSAPICTGYYSMACMRHLPDTTTLVRALETPGQESLAPGCTGVTSVINICVVLFILAHICGVTQHVLVVNGNAVNSLNPFKSDHLRSSPSIPFFPSLSSSRAQRVRHSSIDSMSKLMIVLWTSRKGMF